MDTFEQSELYKQFCNRKIKGEDAEIYNILCVDGVGTMSGYEVFPGVDVFRNHFRAYHCNERRSVSNLMQLNFCVSGRFECYFTKQECSILHPGDFSVSLFDGENGIASVSRFPLGYYEGLGLYVDCDLATKWAGENLAAFDLDFCEIRRRLLSSDWYFISPAGVKCEHVFRELYEGVSNMGLPYLRLKVAELFLLLLEFPLKTKVSSYFSADQIELAKHIRDHIISDNDNYSSVERLAAEHEISVTQLQKIFRRVYGVPIYTYLREYRLERAAYALQDTDMSITAIAMEAGFTNPGKFSEGFKKRYGTTPTKYRKMKTQ